MTTQAERSPPRLRDHRRLRLVGSGLGILYALFLVTRGEAGAAIVVVLISTVAAISCFARPNQPGLRRGSFLLVGTLVIADYFLFLLVSIRTGIVPRLGLLALAVVVATATLTEGTYAFDRTPARRYMSDRIALFACRFIVVFCVGATVYLYLS